MNKNRVYSILFLLITIPGLGLISIGQLFFGSIFVIGGLAPGVVFLRKARKEEA